MVIDDGVCGQVPGWTSELIDLQPVEAAEPEENLKQGWKYFDPRKSLSKSKSKGKGKTTKWKKRLRLKMSLCVEPIVQCGEQLSWWTWGLQEGWSESETWTQKRQRAKILQEHS